MIKINLNNLIKIKIYKNVPSKIKKKTDIPSDQPLTSVVQSYCRSFIVLVLCREITLLDHTTVNRIPK